LGSWLNRWVWKALDQRLQQKVDPVLNEMVVSLGGEPRRSFTLQSGYSPRLHLVAASPTLVPRQPDLPERIQIVGAWAPPKDPSRRGPSAQLVEFLGSGPPPVVATFGSMGGNRGERWRDIFRQAILETGQRAVIQAGWSGIRGESSEVGRILYTDWVPHDYLFPRASMVIHHGGAGTTHAACRSGVPSIIVCFLNDQPFWARALYRKGIAPRGIAARKLTVSRLAGRIRRVLTTPEMSQRARAVAAEMGREDGFGTTAAVLEDLLAEQRVHRAS
jgi:UDP:flavonoid glycosyltransferase YjiC (YdhE family)